MTTRGAHRISASQGDDHALTIGVRFERGDRDTVADIGSGSGRRIEHCGVEIRPQDHPEHRLRLPVGFAPTAHPTSTSHRSRRPGSARRVPRRTARTARWTARPAHRRRSCSAAAGHVPAPAPGRHAAQPPWPRTPRPAPRRRPRRRTHVTGRRFADQRRVTWRLTTPARARRAAVSSGSVSASAASSRPVSAASGSSQRGRLLRRLKRQVPDGDDQPERPEGADVLRALPQPQFAAGRQPSKGVEQRLLVLREHPAQVAALTDAAPVRRGRRAQPDGRHHAGIGLLQGSRDLAVLLRSRRLPATSRSRRKRSPRADPR